MRDFFFPTGRTAQEISDADQGSLTKGGKQAGAAAGDKDWALGQAFVQVTPPAEAARARFLSTCVDFCAARTPSHGRARVFLVVQVIDTQLVERSLPARPSAPL